MIKTIYENAQNLLTVSAQMTSVLYLNKALQYRIATGMHMPILPGYLEDPWIQAKSPCLRYGSLNLTDMKEIEKFEAVL